MAIANEWIIKDYAGGAVATTMVGAISGSATSIVLTSGSTFPDGTAGPFVVCLEPGVAEEKVLCTSRSGNTLTVLQRGYDGTAAVAHLTLITVTHVLDAFTIKQANALASAMLTTGAMAYRGAGFTYTPIPIGTTGLPLVAGAVGPGYAALDVNGLAAAVLQRLVPAGAIQMTIGATPDTGFLFIDGSTIVSAQTLYPALWARIPVAWQSGSSMVFPDWRGRAPVAAGAGAGLTARTLAAVFGAETVQLAASESGLVGHNHTQDPHNHTQDVHNHTQNAHTHPISGTGQLIYRDSAYNTGYTGRYQAADLALNYEALQNATATNIAATATNQAQTATNQAAAAATAAAAHNNMQPSFAVNFQIKAH